MTTNHPTELLSDEALAAHKAHLDDDLEKIAEFGVSIESYPWLVRERDLHGHIATLREQLAQARAQIKAQDERIVNQRDEIKERVRLQADAERTVQAYRDAVGVEPHRIDGLRIIEEMKARLAQVEKERNEVQQKLMRRCTHPNTYPSKETKRRCHDCGNAKVEEFYDGADPQLMFVVTCEVCPVQTYDQFSAQEAITIWNTHVSSRDTEIREVLEGLRFRHGCWCELPPNAGSPDHTDDCLAARKLYEQVQPVKEGNPLTENTAGS